jgi:thiol:disulfide interchange protein DsbD
MESPVDWIFASRKIDDKTYEILAIARITPPWHIYSQQTEADLGLPTTFIFKKNPLIEVVGKPKEIGNLMEETQLGSKIRFYMNQVQFVQTVKIKQGVKTKLTIKGVVEFMACNNGNCLPEDNISFNIALD